MAGGAISRRLNKPTNILELTVQELRIIYQTSEGEEKFTDRPEDGKIIRYYGTIKLITTSCRAITKQNQTQNIELTKTCLEWTRKEDTGFVKEPEPKPTRNHTWGV